MPDVQPLRLPARKKSLLSRGYQRVDRLGFPAGLCATMVYLTVNMLVISPNKSIVTATNCGTYAGDDYLLLVLSVSLSEQINTD
jgi:hypothetical protein